MNYKSPNRFKLLNQEELIWEDTEQQGIPEPGTAEHKPVDRAVHIRVQEPGIPPLVDTVDRYATSAGTVGFPSAVVVRTCHPFCPSQPCVVSANRYIMCNLETIRL